MFSEWNVLKEGRKIIQITQICSIWYFNGVVIKVKQSKLTVIISSFPFKVQKLS